MLILLFFVWVIAVFGCAGGVADWEHFNWFGRLVTVVLGVAVVAGLVASGVLA